MNDEERFSEKGYNDILAKIGYEVLKYHRHIHHFDTISKLTIARLEKDGCIVTKKHNEFEVISPNLNLLG